MADQTGPLNFSSDSPSDIVAKINYKGLQLNTPITASMFSAPKDDSYQAFTTPVEPLTLNLGINDIWTNILASKDFLQKYKDKRNETKLQCPDWEFNEDRSCALRLIRNIVIVDAPLPNTPTNFVEAHRVIAVKRDGQYELLFQNSAQTPDVISGTTFRVESLIHATAASLEGPTTITFNGNVLKCSAGFYAIKFIAVPRAMRETGDAMRQYSALMAEAAKDVAPSSKGDGDAKAPEAPAASPTAASHPPVPAVPSPRPPSTSKDAAVPPSTLTSVLPSVTTMVALLVLGAVAWSSMSTLGQLRTSVELQNRRWSLIEQHKVGGVPQQTAPSYKHYLQEPEVPIRPVQSAPAPSVDHRREEENGKDSTVPRWAHVVVEEVASLQSRLSTAYWVIIMQLLAIVGFVAKKSLMG